MGAAHGARAVTGQEWGAHSPVGLANQGRRRMIGRGGVAATHSSYSGHSSRSRRRPPPRSMGQRPRAPPSGGWMGSGRTGHLLAQGSREFPKGPLRQLLMPLEGKGGPLEGKEVQRAGDWRPRFWGAAPPPSAALRACASEGVRGGHGGGGTVWPSPTAWRVSDCPDSGSSAPPNPHVVSKGSTPSDVTTGGGTLRPRGH